MGKPVKNAATADENEGNFINPADFNSMELKISATNLGNKVELRDGQRILPRDRKPKKNSSVAEIRKDDGRIDFLELLESGLVLEVPAEFALRDAQVYLEIEVIHSPSPLKFSMTCKVLQTERAGALTYDKDKGVESNVEERDTIRLEIVQVEAADWKALGDVFSSRQDEILSFFLAAKGA